MEQQSAAGAVFLLALLNAWLASRRERSAAKWFIGTMLLAPFAPFMTLYLLTHPEGVGAFWHAEPSLGVDQARGPRHGDRCDRLRGARERHGTTTRRSHCYVTAPANAGAVSVVSRQRAALGCASRREHGPPDPATREVAVAQAGVAT